MFGLFQSISSANLFKSVLHHLLIYSPLKQERGIVTSWSAQVNSPAVVFLPPLCSSMCLYPLFYAYSEEPAAVIFSPVYQRVPWASLRFTKADIMLLFINTGELEGELIAQLMQKAISVCYKIGLGTPVPRSSRSRFQILLFSLSLPLFHFLKFHLLLSQCCLFAVVFTMSDSLRERLWLSRCSQDQEEKAVCPPERAQL